LAGLQDTFERARTIATRPKTVVRPA
jgi:hypothetical protein